MGNTNTGVGALAGHAVLRYAAWPSAATPVSSIRGPNSCSQTQYSSPARIAIERPRLVRNKVKAAFGVGSSRLMVGGAILSRIANSVATTPACVAGALRVPDQALERRAGQLIGVPVERKPGGARLNTIVQLRRRAVIVDTRDRLLR